MEQRAERRLYRSRNDRVLTGVCGGLAKYFSIDPVLVRILAAVITLCSFCVGILGYILLALFVPVEE
uniref:Phage shock protein PspC N-terminal domain-containing protein n=1 Tax=uncultured Dehalococcoidia bacterium TaxID=498747 RepID=A0A871YEE9_9CHLR|nr:hypothetical protein HULAa30F3_00019 [uncultured Dehalococcoidia bacterium]